MKKFQTILVVAAFFAAFIAAPAEAEIPTTGGLAKEYQAKLDQCEKRSIETAEALEKCLEGKKTETGSSDPAPKLELVCEPPASTPNEGCVCPEGYERHVVLATKFVFTKVVHIGCSPTKATIDDLQSQINGLRQEIANLEPGVSRKDMEALEKRLAALLKEASESQKKEIEKLRNELGERLDDHEERIEDLEERDALDYLELGLGATAAVTSRFRSGYTTTLGLGGKLKLTAWVTDGFGIRGSGTMAYGINPNAALTVGIWTLGPTLALDRDRNHTLTLSIAGLREEARQATNISGVFGVVEYQAHLSKALFLDAAIGLGSSNENLFTNDVRGDVTSGLFGGIAQLTFGGYIGGDAPPPQRSRRASSSAETGGSVSTP